MKTFNENTGIAFPKLYVLETEHEGINLFLGKSKLVKRKRDAIHFPSERSAQLFIDDATTMPEHYKIVPLYDGN